MKRISFIVVSVLVLPLISCASFSMKSQAENQRFRIVIDDSSKTLEILREGSNETTSKVGHEKPPVGDSTVYSPEELEVYVGSVLKDLLQIDVDGQGLIKVEIGPLAQTYSAWRKGAYVPRIGGTVGGGNIFTGWRFDLNIGIYSNHLHLWSWKKTIEIPAHEFGLSTVKPYISNALKEMADGLEQKLNK